MKLTVVGAGAIGGIVGAHLIRAGHDITFVDENVEHVEAIRKSGLKISGASNFTVHPPALLPSEIQEPLDAVLLAVKSRHTNTAMETIAKHLSPTGYVVSLQNGLEEYKIANLVGDERTVGGFLTFGGHFKQPGEITFGGTGSLYVGEIDGTQSERVNQLQQVLSALQPVNVTNNIFGFLWGKTALGGFYFATALVNADVPDIIDQGEYLETLGNIVAEVVRVGEACGVTCEVIDGFDPKIFTTEHPEGAAITTSWNAQKAYWDSHVQEQKRTGVWRDLAIHRRPTEVDHILGPVLERASAKGLHVPRLTRLVELIKAVESGERELGWENLDVLRELDQALHVS